MTTLPAPGRWRSAALLFLWLDVAGCLGTAAYQLWINNFRGLIWIDVLNLLLGGVVLAWWTTIFGRVTLGVSVPKTDGTLRALALSFPWLTSLRLVIWGLTLLTILDGEFPTANPVALTAMLTVWGASILTANAVNAGLVRLALAPPDKARKTAAQYADWLNLAAALSLGMLVINLMPIKGYDTTPPSAALRAVYAGGGLLDLISGVLSFLAVHALTRPRRD